MSATRTEAESVGSSAPAMRVDRVTKEFGGLIAVNDVSIDVPARSIAATGT